MEGSPILEASTNTTNSRGASHKYPEKNINHQHHSTDKETTLERDNFSGTADHLPHLENDVTKMDSPNSAKSTSVIDLTSEGIHEHAHDDTAPSERTPLPISDIDKLKPSSQQVLGTSPVIDLTSDGSSSCRVTPPGRVFNNAENIPENIVDNNATLIERAVDTSSVIDLTFEGPKEKTDNITDDITKDVTKDVAVDISDITNDVTVGVNDDVTNALTETISADKAAAWIMENIDENVSSITLDDFSTDARQVNHSTELTMSAADNQTGNRNEGNQTMSVDSVTGSTRPGNRTISPTDPAKLANEGTSSTNLKDSACIVIEPTSTVPTNYMKHTNSMDGVTTISVRPARHESPAAKSTNPAGLVHKHKSVVNNRPPRVASRSGHPARHRIQSVGDRILEKYGYRRKSSAVLTASASVYFFKPAACVRKTNNPRKILEKHGYRRNSLGKPSAKSSATSKPSAINSFTPAKSAVTGNQHVVNPVRTATSATNSVNPPKPASRAINSINKNMPQARVLGSFNPVIPIVPVKPFTPITNTTRIINPTNAARLVNPPLPGFAMTDSTNSLASTINALVSVNPPGYAPILPKPRTVTTSGSTVKMIDVKMTHTIINEQGRSIVITTGTGPDGPLEPVFSTLSKLNSPNPSGSGQIQIRPQSKTANNTVGNATSVQVQGSVISAKNLTSLRPVQVGSNTSVGPQTSCLLPTNPAGQIAMPVTIVNNTSSLPAVNVLNNSILGPQENSPSTGSIVQTNQVALPVTITTNASLLPAVTMQSSINHPVAGNVVTTNQVAVPLKVISTINPVVPVQAAAPLKVIGNINPLKPVQVVNTANTGNWLQFPLVTNNVSTPVNIAQATAQPNPVPMATNNNSTSVNIIQATDQANPVPVVANPTVLHVNSGSVKQVAAPMQAVSYTCRPAGTVNPSGTCTNQGAVQLIGSIIPRSKNTVSPTKTMLLPVTSSIGNQVAVPLQSVSNSAWPVGKINRASGTNQGAVQLLGSIVPLSKNPTKTTQDIDSASKPIMASLLRDSVTDNSNLESQPESYKVIVIEDELPNKSGLHHGTSGSSFTGGTLCSY